MNRRTMLSTSAALALSPLLGFSTTADAMYAAPLAAQDSGQRKPRARDLGVPFDGVPGPLNAITDVAGVRVEHLTLIEGDGALEVGTGPIRTGLTAILPRADAFPVFSAWDVLNGTGEMTGTELLDESGYLIRRCRSPTR